MVSLSLRSFFLLLTLCLMFVSSLKCYVGQHSKDTLEKRSEARKKFRMHDAYDSFSRRDPELAKRVAADEEKSYVLDEYGEETCRAEKTVCAKVENSERVWKGCIRQSECNKGFSDVLQVAASLWCCNKELCNYQPSALPLPAVVFFFVFFL